MDSYRHDSGYTGSSGLTPSHFKPLTPEETAEFELLDAQFPLDGKPAWRPSDLPLSPKEQRWLELFRRMEAARKQTAA